MCQYLQQRGHIPTCPLPTPSSATMAFGLCSLRYSMLALMAKEEAWVRLEPGEHT